MSKKRKRPDVASLVLASLVLDRAWAYERRIVDGLPWPSIRALAVRPRELGGIGRDPGIGGIKALIAQHRAEQGEVNGSREERIERRQLEIDAVALAARRALARADEVGGLDVHAAKVLLDVRAAEAKMHGDDAALRIDADVTHHDGATAELYAMLDEAGVPRPEEARER